MSNVPDLEHHCNSWIAIRKSDGKVIGEFYNLSSVERFNPEKVLIQTAVQYLSSLNKPGGQN
jgi:hypothetical protein